MCASAALSVIALHTGDVEGLIVWSESAAATEPHFEDVSENVLGKFV